MKHWTVVCAALALVLAGAGSGHADNIVVNGGFETGNFNGWTNNSSYNIVFGGPHHVGGYAGGVGPHSGDYYAALGTVGSLVTLSQTLNTVAGQTYTLSYFMANDGNTPNEFKVQWNGSTLFDQTNIANQGYTGYSFQVTATGATSTLAFLERNDPGYLSLDDVAVLGQASVQASGQGAGNAPEPSSVVLLGLGMIGVACYKRIRQLSGQACQPDCRHSFRCFSDELLVPCHACCFSETTIDRALGSAGSWPTQSVVEADWRRKP